MQLVHHNDSILRTPAIDFDFTSPPFDPTEFSKQLIKFVYDNNGLGIAANQVGTQYRIIAMRGSPENFVCYNPRIITPSDQQVILDESSLTYPGLVVKVKRAQHIRCRFQTPNGDTRTETFTGMSARVFQHLLDHLDGNLFFNKANRYHRDKALNKWRAA